MKHSDNEPLAASRLHSSIKYLFLLAASLILASCEKEVKFNLKSEASKLVVEGVIETGMPPLVRLSKSIGFFSKIDLQTLSDAYVHQAEITVSDGSQTVALKEYHLTQGSISLYFYSVDTASQQALLFIGTPGKTYQLSIKYGGKTYQSQTSIPFPKPLDSIWAVAPPASEMPKDYPDSRLLYAQYTDPDTPGNRIRYFTKRNSGPFLPAFYSVYDDEIINGTTIQIQMPAGYQKMDTFNLQTYGYFYKGDTVVVKWCSIDKNVFNFWRTLEYSYGATGNPFSTPVEVSTNISGGALGVWAGYGATYDTLVISN